MWDYPIKEQYGHILNAIEQVGPVATYDEGFDKVSLSIAIIYQMKKVNKILFSVHLNSR